MHTGEKKMFACQNPNLLTGGQYVACEGSSDLKLTRQHRTEPGPQVVSPLVRDETSDRHPAWDPEPWISSHHLEMRNANWQSNCSRFVQEVDARIWYCLLLAFWYIWPCWYISKRTIAWLIYVARLELCQTLLCPLIARGKSGSTEDMVNFCNDISWTLHGESIITSTIPLKLEGTLKFFFFWRHVNIIQEPKCNLFLKSESQPYLLHWMQCHLPCSIRRPSEKN